MKSGKLFILAIIAVALCVAAIIAYNQNTAPSVATGGIARGGALMPSLAKASGDVARLQVSKSSETLVLTRGDNDEWSLASLFDYPADPEQVAKLMFDLTDLKVSDCLTDKPDRYGKFGLKDGGPDRRSVLFSDKSGKELARLVLGSERQSESEEPDMESPRGGGRYVLAGNDLHVYLVQENLSWVTPEVKEWAKKDIADVADKDILSAGVDHGTTESFSISWDKDTPVIEGLDKDHKPKTWEANNVRGALKELKLSGVLSAASTETKALKTKATYMATAKDGTVYTVKAMELGAKRCIALSAAYSEPVFTAEDNATTTSLAEAKKKAGKAKNGIEAFNKRHAPWVYELESWTWEKFTKRRNDVTESAAESKPATPEPEKEAAGTPKAGTPKAGAAKKAPAPAKKASPAAKKPATDAKKGKPADTKKAPAKSVAAPSPGK